MYFFEHKISQKRDPWPRRQKTTNQPTAITVYNAVHD
jgi:hypothetical protein